MRNVLSFLNTLEQKAGEFELERTPFEDYYRMPELKVLRYLLTKPVFLKLIDELVRSMNCEVTERGSEHIYLKEGGTFFQLRNGDTWTCTCHYL